MHERDVHGRARQAGASGRTCVLTCARACAHQQYTLTCNRMGKRLIVVANESLMDNHQMELAHAMQARGLSLSLPPSPPPSLPSSHPPPPISLSLSRLLLVFPRSSQSLVPHSPSLPLPPSRSLPPAPSLPLLSSRSFPLSHSLPPALHLFPSLFLADLLACWLVDHECHGARTSYTLHLHPKSTSQAAHCSLHSTRKKYIAIYTTFSPSCSHTPPQREHTTRHRVCGSSNIRDTVASHT